MIRRLTRNGDRRGVGEDELDLVEALATAPVLDGRRPAVARVAEAVDEDDGGRVPGRGREHKRLGPHDCRHFIFLKWGRCYRVWAYTEVDARGPDT